MATIGWNEIRERAISFAKDYEDSVREEADAQSFLNDFFYIFGIDRKRVATFEHKVPVNDGAGNGYIDLLWKGKILIEMKSRGKDLEKAYQQAKNYVSGLKELDLPKIILISDFERMRIYDLENSLNFEIMLSDLYKNVKLFGFLAGYTKTEYKESDPINIKAAEKMGLIHDQLKSSGYDGHELELYLVRLLFCLFADDTSIFDTDIFYEYIKNSREDGEDLSQRLAILFQVLNTPDDKRNKNISDELMHFPYVNGGLFSETLSMPIFNKQMREELLSVCGLDWSAISPAIFGAMFQSVMNQEERRKLGAHYTSEKNIQKLIEPLFLSDLYTEFEKSKSNKKKLEEFHNKISNLKFLDPACGCGNFLVITYKKLRELEIEVLKAIHGKQGVMDISLIQKVSVNQFYGIEIEEFPSLIAQTAMWLTDHQMNMELSQEFGQYFLRLPLLETANIVNANALNTEWSDIIKSEDLNYILGNPPFIGARLMNEEQKKDMAAIFEEINGYGNLDYVTAWYKKACDFINKTNIEVAFVSTNSICQGEQVAILWKFLFDNYDIKINFAHQTFKWTNEATGKAAVFCVIVGFSQQNKPIKKLYIYEDIKAEPHLLESKNINAYLIDADNILIEKRSKSINHDKEIVYGSFILDDGNYTISEDEYKSIIALEPQSEKFFKKFIGSEELINNKIRYCVWLYGYTLSDYRNSPIILEKIKNVQLWRSRSARPTTQKLALTPTQWAEVRQPKSNYLMIPIVSSERRKYIPVGYLDKEIIASNATLIIPDATLFEFGILTSNMHMTWVKYVCGRLKSDYRYSASIVYNNFPWPEPIESLKKEIEDGAQEILDVRIIYKDSSLADLYDPLFMPVELVKAHNKLDKIVEKAYGKVFKSDSERISHLFKLYSELINK